MITGLNLPLGFHHSSQDSASSAFSANPLIADILFRTTLDTPERTSPAAEAVRSLYQKSQEGPESSLSHCYSLLSARDQGFLQQRFGRRLSELLALSRESDPELLAESLLSLGQRALHSSDTLLATRIFEFLLHPSAELNFPIPSQVRQRAQEEYNAILGVGSVGKRLEFLSRNFARQVAAPEMLLGMTFAGMMAGGIRLGALGRLAVRPASFWTRGLIADSLASAIAFPAEALTFWGVGRAVGQVLHPELQAWDGESIAHELTSLSLTLACLKIGGGITQRIFDRVHGINPLTGEITRLPQSVRFSRPVFHQAGMFAGIALSHYAESRLGFRPPSSGDTFWTDSLVTLLNFNIAGHLSQQLMGPRYAALMREMALRTQHLETQGRGGEGRASGEIWNSILRRFFPARGAVTPDGQIIFVEENAPLGLRTSDSTSMMVGSGEGGGNGSSSSGKPGELVTERAVTVVERNLPSTIESLVRIYRSGDIHLSEKTRFGAELFPHIEIVKQVLQRMRLQDEQLEPNPARRLTEWDVESVLQSIRARHFESVSDKLLECIQKFKYLRDVLREQLQSGTREEREETHSLLDSVELKFLEATRYYYDAESYLADDKGPGPKSPFTENRYSTIFANFNYHLERFQRFFERKPELQTLLEEFRNELIPRYDRPITREEILESLHELEKKGLPTHLLDRLREALASDPSALQGEDLFPIAQAIRRLLGEITSEEFFERYRPLQEYLEVLAEIRNHLSEHEIREMGVYPWQTTEGLLSVENSAREELGAALRLKMNPEAADSLVGSYFVTRADLIQTTEPFRPSHRTVVLSWSDVQKHLVRVQERGILKSETVEKIFHWCEATGDRPNKPVIFSIREDAMAGLIDFILKDTLTPEARTEVTDLLDEVVRRDDSRMMEALAIRFQNYRLGVMRDRLQIKERPSEDPLTNEMALEAYDHFLETLRVTARFYRENAVVRGPYLEIFEKIISGRRDSIAELAGPILHQTQRLLGQVRIKNYKSKIPAAFWRPVRSIELSSRGGRGDAVLEFVDPEGYEVVMGLTSILQTLDSRGRFTWWLDRVEKTLTHDPENILGSNGEPSRIISIQISSVRSGVPKREIFQWARDYLEEHPAIEEIHLQIPEQGNEVKDPLNPDQFSYEVVTRRNMPTTQVLIENFQMDVRDQPERLLPRLELYRLRRSLYAPDQIRSEDWELLKEIHQLFPNDSVVRTEFQRALGILYKELNRAPSIQNQKMAEARNAASRFLEIFQSEVEGTLSEDHQTEAGGALERITEFTQTDFDLGVPAQLKTELEEAVRMLHELTPSAKADETGEVRSFGGAQDTLRILSEQIQNVFDPGLSLERTADFINAALETHLPPQRFQNLIELAPSEFGVRKLQIGFGTQGISFRGEIHPPKSLHQSIKDKVGPAEVTEGYFSLRFHRDPKTGVLQSYFENLNLPPALQRQGVGTLFFSEFVRLSREMRVPLIFADQATGMHANWGMRFRDSYERNKMVVLFEVFVEKYLKKLPMGPYDLSPIRNIENPQQVARATLDPHTRTIEFPRDVLKDEDSDVFIQLHPEFQVGNLFMQYHEGHPWNAVFDPDPESLSSRILGRYLQRVISRLYPYAPREIH